MYFGSGKEVMVNNYEYKGGFRSNRFHSKGHLKFKNGKEQNGFFFLGEYLGPCETSEEKFEKLCIERSFLLNRSLFST